MKMSLCWAGVLLALARALGCSRGADVGKVPVEFRSVGGEPVVVRVDLDAERDAMFGELAGAFDRVFVLPERVVERTVLGTIEIDWEHTEPWGAVDEEIESQRPDVQIASTQTWHLFRHYRLVALPEGETDMPLRVEVRDGPDWDWEERATAIDAGGLAVVRTIAVDHLVDDLKLVRDHMEPTREPLGWLFRQQRARIPESFSLRALRQKKSLA